MWLLLIQVLGLGLLALLAVYMEKNAAMRGCNRAPLSPTVDRLLRICFLLIVAGPTFWWLDSSVLPVPLAVPALLLYMVPYSDLCETNGGRAVLYSRRWGVWKWLIRRLNLKVVKTVDLPADQPYVFGCHPHGVLPMAGALGMSVEASDSFHSLFPNINVRSLAATFCFLIPLYRDMMLWGGVVDAARYSARKVLDLGYSLVVFPGGASEALHARPDADVILLRNRRGFIKLALHAGASLVPVFTFNENNTYRQYGTNSPIITAIKTRFQAVFGISLPVLLHILPRSTRATLVVGSPIPVPQTEDPDAELVDAYLAKYIDALEQLYNDHRAKYNDPPTKPPLKIV